MSRTNHQICKALFKVPICKVPFKVPLCEALFKVPVYGALSLTEMFSFENKKTNFLC